MHLHLYTSWENTEKLFIGESITAWLKCVAEESDVHISVDKDQCYIIPTGKPHIFNVVTK